MEYALTTLNVSDFQNSLEFYRDVLGLPVIQTFKSKGGGDIAMLGDAASAHLELICTGEATICPQPGISIGFKVDNASIILNKIGRDFDGPIMPNPNLRFYFTTDPDGYRIQLLELVANSESE